MSYWNQIDYDVIMALAPNDTLESLTNFDINDK